MGKARIVSGGTDGQYQIKILVHKTAAEARAKKLQDEIDKLRSGEDVIFFPLLSDQRTTLLSLIDDYRDAIEDNRNKEEDQAELVNDIAFEQTKLDRLEDELDALESIRDTRSDEYDDAQDQYDLGEITEEELEWYESRYLTAQANVVAKSSSVNSKQATVAALEAEKTAIKFAELDKDLDTIKKKSEVFFEFDAKEPVSQLDEHVGYGEAIISHMAEAFNVSIEWYNDATKQNYQDAMDKAEWESEQYPVSVQVDEAYTAMNAAKGDRDSAQDEYDDAELAVIRGTGTEEELEEAAEALAIAQANYSAKLATYNVRYNAWEELEAQINGCVQIKTDPMLTRLTNTHLAYEAMSQDLGKLTAFRDMQELKITSMEKRLDELEAELDKAERTQSAWCADLTEDLAADAEVGTIEIMGEPDTILIRPGYDDDAVYTQARDGQLQPPAISTAAQAFYNYALLPGWQKWKPTYRVGKITALDGDTCTVRLDAVRSVAQGLDVNQENVLTDIGIIYMNCGGKAFKVGDRVVVRFLDQDWANPKVIGFESEPQKCDDEYLVIAIGGEGYELCFVWDIAANDYAQIDEIESWPCALDTLNESDWMKGMDSIMRSAPRTNTGDYNYIYDEPVGQDYNGADLYCTISTTPTGGATLWHPCRQLPSDETWWEVLERRWRLYDLSHPAYYEVNAKVFTAPPMSATYALPRGKTIVVNLQEHYDTQFEVGEKRVASWPYGRVITIPDGIRSASARRKCYLNTPLTGQIQLWESYREWTTEVDYTDESVADQLPWQQVIYGDHSICTLFFADIREVRYVSPFLYFLPVPSVGYEDGVYDQHAQTEERSRKLTGFASASVVQDFDTYDPIKDQCSNELFAALELLFDSWYVGAGIPMTERVGEWGLAVDILCASTGED
jgi:hypothetical protein